MVLFTFFERELDKLSQVIDINIMSKTNIYSRKFLLSIVWDITIRWYSSFVLKLKWFLLVPSLKMNVEQVTIFQFAKHDKEKFPPDGGDPWPEIPANI